MRFRTCGVFPPRDDIHQTLSSAANTVSSCIRLTKHIGDHISLQENEKYVGWLNDEDCTPRKSPDHNQLWWDLDDEEVEDILSSERLLD